LAGNPFCPATRSRDGSLHGHQGSLAVYALFVVLFDPDGRV
jgi:hypothetical protein